ncbi:ATPase, T2SS/T4P/T4SS family [Caldibacillus debilis]|uniref:Flp pilus assembly protein, ATPase CpaF n=1 Tax=Caldibacillus debilis GB1 TaxID=1339248 RepID=A0A420VEJ9_9BACI|nr:ATPase, T2SS/T4P/T4SS family [Caldibacillus debilis]RKO61793.1 Flp pilus assembly protein, ATPase CpaF [Caldibacillus debilis GB1]
MSTKNPILVLKNGKKARVQELKLEMGRDFQIIEVYTKNGDLLAKQYIANEPYLALDSELETVKVVYKTEKNEYIDEEVLDLRVDDDDSKYYTEEELRYMEIKRYIEHEMDNPQGSEKEKAEHTRLLKESCVDESARRYVTSRIRRLLLAREDIPPEEIDDLAYKLFADLYGMGVIQELDDDPSVGEIMVNARVFPRFQSSIYYYRGGPKQQYYYEFRTLEELKNVLDRLVAFNKKSINSVETAIVEATRPNRDRVNIIVPDASENYVLNIRRFTNFIPNLEMMKKVGTVDDFIDKLMSVLVRGKANIGVGGPMGVGKTTFVNFLLTYTDPIERKAVIASVAETDVDRVLAGHDVILLNVDESKGFTFDKLIRASLRTTADRIIIPESRGGEFRQIYEANLKTRGNMFTAHALDDEGFLEMCVDMYKSSPESAQENSNDVRNRLAKSIDVVIMMRKAGNKIRIKSISEVMQNEKGEYAGMNCLYKWEFDPENPMQGHYVRTQNRMSDSLKRRLNEFGVSMSELKEF